MKRDLNWLKAKADIRIGCFDMVSMGYAIEMYNEDQVHIEKLEKEITERDARVSELENKLKKYRSDEIEKEVEKLEKQNARMRECLCRIIEFENCENHFMTYTSSVAKKTLEELEGEE